MSEQQRNIKIDVGGSNEGQIVAGSHNIVTQSIGPRPAEVGGADWDELRRALTTLGSQVAAQAPADEQLEASQQVAELAGASTQERPDVKTMSSVWSWFLHHAPTMMGAVATVVFHPVVGALIRAAGDALTEEFERHFGRSPGG